MKNNEKPTKWPIGKESNLNLNEPKSSEIPFVCLNTIHWNKKDGSAHIYPAKGLKYALIEKRYIPILIDQLQKHFRGEEVFQV